MWAHQKRTRGARIGTTTWAAVEGRAMPIRSTRRTASAGLLTGVLVVLFGAALASAAPASAADRPPRPPPRPRPPPPPRRPRHARAELPPGRSRRRGGRRNVALFGAAGDHPD